MVRVEDDHAGELLTLRRAAFVTEAQQYGDPHIPPLTQTLEELQADLERDGVITLGGWYGHRLVGSIRVLIEGPKATLGRFAVAPDLQGQGFGTQMLMAILPFLPEGIEEVWVFTGRDSVMFPPCSASSPATACTIPGRSGQERVRTQWVGLSESEDTRSESSGRGDRLTRWAP